MPPLITMLPESRRPPYPITWDEQDRLFPKLPARLARMVLFAINTGVRESNVCRLEWAWEVKVPEVGRSVFVIPPESFKSKRAHVVILNDAAWSIIEEQRGKDPIWVFPHRGKPVGTMNCGIHRHRFNSGTADTIRRLGEAKPKVSAMCSAAIAWSFFQSLYRIRSFDSS
jgi:integrase